MWRATTLLLALLAALPMACDPEFTVCVTVRDCATGRALSGVDVTFLYKPNLPMDGSQGDTDSTGDFCGGDVGSTSPPNPYFVVLQAPGYGQETIQVDGGASNSTQCMSASAEAADAGARD